MREIKFRAWDLELRKFEYYNGIFNRRPYTERSTFPQYESITHYHELIVEQYTGLKDKNGKEIYEGDVLEYRLGKVNIGGTKGISGGRFKVYWWDYKWKLLRLYPKLRKDIGGIGIVHDTPRYFEVIGNIHENPELLKGET